MALEQSKDLLNDDYFMDMKSSEMTSETTTSRDYKFIVGMVLSILGFLACINPWYLIFGIPLLVVGLILIWSSTARNGTKVLMTIAPVILWYPGMAALYAISEQRATPETFLIPEDFRGHITIIYDEPCGITIPKENERLVYRIPDIGILITTNPFESGIIDHEYYWIDKNGRMTGQIPRFDKREFNHESWITKNPNEPPRNEVGIFSGGAGSGDYGEKQYHFVDMDVNSWDSLIADNEKTYRKTMHSHDEMVINFLKDCRTKGQ